MKIHNYEPTLSGGSGVNPSGGPCTFCVPILIGCRTVRDVMSNLPLRANGILTPASSRLHLSSPTTHDYSNIAAEWKSEM